MENALVVALSRQAVMERQMEVIANNIANASTPGFKGEQMLFVEYLMQTKGGETVSYVQDIGVVRNYDEGEMSSTGNSLDAAIHGKGWFVVDTPDGPAYTRNGHFSINPRGQLVNSGGHPVMSSTGSPITIGPEDTGIEISADGTISTTAGTKGKLDIVTFKDESELQKASESLFTTDAVPERATEARVIQGMLEGSNVEPIIEMTSMITALRSYQGAGEFVNSDDGILRDAIQVLTDQQA